MTGEQFSLDLLGPIILETRDRLARIEADIAVIKDTLEHHKLAARIEALERKGLS